jgi:hypothetical protein
MPTGFLSRSAVIAACVLTGACLNDRIDAGSKCDVGSPNDNWVNLNFSQDPQQPLCPVKPIRLGEQIQFAEFIYGYPGVPDTTKLPFLLFFDSRLYNNPAAPAIVTLFGSNWLAGNNGRLQNAFGGYYPAATRGTADAPIFSDYAQANVPLTGSTQLATAFVLLPYKVPNYSAARATASPFVKPTHAVPTVERLIPIALSQNAQIRWLLDGSQVWPSINSQPKRDTIITYTVPTAGTHTWTVQIYDGFPGTTTTLTWSQKFK